MRLLYYPQTYCTWVWPIDAHLTSLNEFWEVSKEIVKCEEVIRKKEIKKEHLKADHQDDSLSNIKCPHPCELLSVAWLAHLLVIWLIWVCDHNALKHWSSCKFSFTAWHSFTRGVCRDKSKQLTKTCASEDDPRPGQSRSPGGKEGRVYLKMMLDALTVDVFNIFTALLMYVCLCCSSPPIQRD